MIDLFFNTTPPSPPHFFLGYTPGGAAAPLVMPTYEWFEFIIDIHMFNYQKNLSTSHLTADTVSGEHVFLRHSLLKVHLTDVSTAFMPVF